MFTNSENHFSLSTLGLSNFCQVILPLPGIKYFIIRAHILYKLQADIIRVLICICLESVYDGNRKLWAFFFYEYIGNYVYQL